MPQMPPIRHQPGQTLDGFTVQQVTPLPQMFAVAYLLTHDASGARILHLHTQDTENLFSISFPTPPADDTGLPHILEHAVLAGSKQYPVREPFFEMIKMSMATFINAMTGYDATYYPVSSNVKRDLFNLAEVYFDAVFHPLLTSETFRREGHHLAPADPAKPAGDLTITGIVYNEMKGVFSNPESCLYRGVTRGLFPDTPYGLESGGDPEAIPQLTWQQLCAFHTTRYHPTHAHIYLYGDIPTADYLDFLRPRLAPFTRQPAATPIPRQTRWTQTKRLNQTYPLGQGESFDNKTYLCTTWLTGDASDPMQVAATSILGLILLGHEGAPLRKALIDSGLGEDLIFSGDSSAGFELIFSIGLKGSEAKHVDAFEKLVLDTLRDLAAGTIERSQIDAAFQQAAYHHLEIMPMFPLHTMGRVLDSWLYRRDPLAFLRMHQTLEELRLKVDADPALFNRLIQEKLLGNSHRLTMVLQPDADWQRRQDEAFTAKMRSVRASLSEAEVLRISADAAELERKSGQPNPPEALALLPQLGISDLPAEPRRIPTTIERIGSATFGGGGGVTSGGGATSGGGGPILLIQDVFSNGVVYLQLDFNLVGLPADLWPVLPRYMDAIEKMGAAGQPYDVVAQRVAAVTGGISCADSLQAHALDPQRPVWGMRLGLKALDGALPKALDVLHDLLFAVDPRDKARLREVLTQAKAGYQTALVHEGSVTATTHAKRGFSPESYLDELTSGLPQLDHCRKNLDQFDLSAETLMAQIERVRDFLLNPARLTASVTGSDASVKQVRQTLANWASAMRPAAVVPTALDFRQHTGQREGLAGPVQVSYCVQALPAPHYIDPIEPLVALGSRLVSMEYMLAEVRFKGNAYGAWCQYDSLGGAMALGSYRDPHITRTLGIMAGAADYVRHAGWSQTDIDRAIIASAKQEEKPIRPGEATGTALARHLLGLTQEVRAARYERLRAATAPRVKQVIGEVLDAGLAKSAVCVVSSRTLLEQANKELPTQPLEITEIV